MSGTVFGHDIAFDRPDLCNWIEDFVGREKAAFKGSSTDDEHAAVRGTDPAMIRTMKVHRRGRSESLSARVVDIALIVRAGARKSTGHEHGSVREQIHLMVRSRCPHGGREFGKGVSG